MNPNNFVHAASPSFPLPNGTRMPIKENYTLRREFSPIRSNVILD